MMSGDQPLDPSVRAACVARARRPLAPEVHRALVAQNARLAPSPARDAYLAALADGAAAVVTGQQVGLFLGPLYTIYKAASAIALARSLAAETGAPVVPVFWLQTEDHDLVEIASCSVPGDGPENACATLALPVDAANRVSIAHHRLPDAVAARLDELDDLSCCRAHCARLRRHYQPGARWVDAFAGVLAELFAPEGLVLIDPRDPVLAAAAAPVHARAIDDADRIAEVLLERDRELASAGRATPVHVRPGAPLSFYHPDGAEGPRVRLAPADAARACDRFVEVGGDRVHPRAELLAELSADPLRFSTSALLRPLVQDTLLPTVAYVGGPGEVAYLAQLQPVYRVFDRTPPLVIPRARFRIVDARARRLLDRLDLLPADAEKSEAELLARLRRTGPGSASVTGQLLDPFVTAHAALAAQLAAVGTGGPPIAKALARTRLSVERAVGRLASKVERAALYADAELVAAVRRLRARLAPGGAPQERVLALAGMAAQWGDRALIERVLAAIDPFDPSLRELA